MVGFARNGNDDVSVRKGARQRVRDELVVELQRVELLVGIHGRFGDALCNAVLVDQPPFALGIGHGRSRDDLCSRDVVASGRL